MEWLNGKLPKIGIRPIIDGRRMGVREALEAQTMILAHAVSDYLSSELKYINGVSVECVIADTTIGGAAEAARCMQKFKDENVGLSISVTPCWCYGSETIDMTPSIPKAIWGFNGTERPGAVYLAAACAAHSQIGDPVFSIYGKNVQDKNDCTIPDDVKAKLKLFTIAGLGVAQIKDKSYLSMGNVAMGIAGSIVDSHFFNDYLGMRCEYVDMSEIQRRIQEEIFDHEEYQRAKSWIKKHCKPQIGIETNRKEIIHTAAKKDEEWNLVAKMALIFRDLMVGNDNLKKINCLEEAEGHNAILAGFQGQRQWTDFMPNGDFAETIMNSSFDWNGIRQVHLVATENDSLNGAAMLLNHVVTNEPQIFADVRTYWSNEAIKRVTGFDLPEAYKNIGIIHLSNSGSAAIDGCGEMTDSTGNHTIKPFYDIEDKDVDACLSKIKWCPAEVEYFRGGGWSVNYKTHGEIPMTMSRISLAAGLGPVLQIVEGYSANLPDEIHNTIDLRTNPTWPTTWFVPIINNEFKMKDAYEVMNNFAANHGAISHGHIGDRLITLASMLRIPVAMHNVSSERIFRPKTWSLFGINNLEAADFNACQNFGPLYGKIKK